MSMRTGHLYGSGKDSRKSPLAGCLDVGDRIGVLAKAGADGFVRYFKNGEAFGGTFSGEIKSPLTVVIQTHISGVSLERLPDAIPPV